MKTKAAIAWKAGAPLTIEEVDLAGPREGEVLVEIKDTGICHTDYYTLSGADPEGIFPSILGHEGAGIVVDVGPGVKSLKKDDHGAPIDNAVWQLYAQVLARTGAVATLIERDNQVPAFSVLQAEARQAEWYLSQVAR